MKLLQCLECRDVFRLTYDDRKCECGKSGGKYVDRLNAEIYGPSMPIGFDNRSLTNAYLMQKIENRYATKDTCCEGVPFRAFYIPDFAKSIKRIDNKNGKKRVPGGV